MSDVLLNNILKAETWRVAADLNHFAHPFSAAQPPYSSGDRVAGIALLAFSLLFIIPGCLYLYWACKKVEHMTSLPEESTDRKAQTVAATLRTDKPKVTQKTTAKSIDGTNIKSIGYLDDDLKNVLIDLINEGLKKQNLSISEDVKILIYLPVSRVELRDKSKILEEISKNASHVIFLQQKGSNIRPPEVGVPVYSLTYECKLGDDLKKTYRISGSDLNLLLQAMAYK